MTPLQDVFSLSVLNTQSSAVIGAQSLLAGSLGMWIVSLHLLLYSFSIFFRVQRSTPHVPLTPAVSAGLLLDLAFATGFPLLTLRRAMFTAAIGSFCFNSTVMSEGEGVCVCHPLLTLAVNRGIWLLAGADALATLLFTGVV